MAIKMTPRAPQLADLLQENTRLKKEIARYQETDRVQKQVIADLRERLNIRSIPSDKLSANDKLFVDASLEFIRKEKPNEQGLVCLPVAKVAEAIGASPDTGSRLLKGITDRFGATHEKVPYVTKAGQRCNLAYINPQDKIWQAPQLADPLPDRERKHGGAPDRCPCGGKLRVKERVITSQQQTVCEDCGTCTTYPVRQVNTPLDVTPDDGELRRTADTTNPVTSVCSSDLWAAVSDNERAPQVADLLETWLRRHIGKNGQKLIFATGKMEKGQKYLSLPLDHEVDLEAYIQGNIARIYGSASLNTDDETTYKLEFDFDDDQPEFDEHHEEYLQAFASAGAAPVYWKRRQGTGHFALYFDRPVDARAAYLWTINVCPDLAGCDECYPIGDKRINRISWPLWYRIGNKVTECPVAAMLPSLPGELITCAGIKSDRARLEEIIAQAVTPASLIPELPAKETIQAQAKEKKAHTQALLEPKLLPFTAPANNGDVARVVIQAWNDAHTWQDVAGVGPGQKFAATWRGDWEGDGGSVHVNTDGTAHDFGEHGSWPAHFDKFEAYCMLNKLDKKMETDKLCAEYRQQTKPAMAATCAPIEKQDAPHMALISDDELEQIRQEFGAERGDPCKCGCTLHWERYGEKVCCNCYRKVTWDVDTSKRLAAMCKPLLQLGA